MKKSRLIQLLNEVDEVHTYMDGGEGLIRCIALPYCDGRIFSSLHYNDAMLRHFDWLREHPGLVKEHQGPRFTSCRCGIPIVMGDFIKSADTGFTGIVEGEGTVTTREWPAWKVRGPNGLSIILKSQAEFIAPDWEREVTE